MKVHLYTVMWNESYILPYFMRYYQDIVDEFFIVDHMSDDNSDEIYAQYDNVTVNKYDNGGEIDDYFYLDVKNNAWKQSRGKADWVIVIDADEFLYHDDGLRNFLETTEATLLHPYGYCMVPKVDFELGEDKQLHELISTGVRQDTSDKMCCFKPDDLVEIQFIPGAHQARPRGIVRKYRDEKLKMLHYKHISLKYVLERNRLMGERLSAKNKQLGLGGHYLFSVEKVTGIHKDYYQANAVEVVNT